MEDGRGGFVRMRDIQMAVEMDDADGTVGFGDAAEKRKSDCVIAA